MSWNYSGQIGCELDVGYQDISTVMLRFGYSAVSWVISFVEVSRSAFEVRTVLIGRAKIFLPDAATSFTELRTFPHW